VPKLRGERFFNKGLSGGESIREKKVNHGLHSGKGNLLIPYKNEIACGKGVRWRTGKRGGKASGGPAP